LAGQSQTTLKDVVLETSDALQPLLNERLRDIARSDGDAGGAWFMAANPDGRKRDDGFLATDVDSRILAAGIDRNWDGTHIGVALFTADDRIGFDGVTDRIRGDREGLSIYARHQGATWYWQGLAGFNRFDSEATRSLQVGSAFSQASSRSSGTGQFLVLEAGRPLSGGFSVALQASADRASLDAFKESGSSGLELGFPDADYDRYLIGPDLRFENPLSKGLSWDAQLGYRHVVNDVETGMRAYYTGLPGTLFTVAGMPYTDGYLQWGLGLGYRTESAYWYLRGNGQHADNSNRFTLSAGLRIGF
jgi:outer membrane autotransporter protein